MTVEEKRKALSAKITEYFNAKSMTVVVPSETLILGSKLNTMQESAIADEELTYRRHIEPKKNYHGTKHEVIKKVPQTKKIPVKHKPASVSSKMTQSEVTAILSKDRKHKLWDKEIYSWSNRDWEELYTLRDEK